MDDVPRAVAGVDRSRRPHEGEMSRPASSLFTPLRIGTFEVMWVDDVPDPVAVTEAVALVRDLSTDESPGFVNGVLGALLRNKESLTG